MGLYGDSQVQQLEFLLRKVCFNIKKRGRVILEDYDLTPAQFDALQLIIKNSDITISELSNSLYQAPSTITDLIDRMEKNQLVKRIKDSKDRRVVRVVPLEKGHKILESVIIERCKFIEYSLSEVSDTDKENFKDYLTILYNASIAEKSSN
ncbi:MarR family transcriptional regulator [Clostridium sp.]|uniref:MarR family winged helix-turn-helix transcriptional regulator n=1 Tax=Clostridium sp. TaxID=1506 RepID=UPI002FCA1E63